AELWKAISDEDKKVNPEWIDPKYSFTDGSTFLSLLQEFALIEFGKQFFYKADLTFQFENRPQPSFNKDFGLLIHNLQENQSAGLTNYIFSDSTKQIE